MQKKIISKKTIIKESRTLFRIISGLVFLLVSISFVFIYLLGYFTSDVVSTLNTVGNLAVTLFILIVFGAFIGLKQILKAVSIIRFINSKDFIIEVDKVIDKYSLSTDTNKCEVIFEYNKAILPINKWKKIKKGTNYYIFNLPKGETIVKRINDYELDDYLKEKLVNYHIKSKNKIENWE